MPDNNWIPEFKKSLAKSLHYPLSFVGERAEGEVNPDSYVMSLEGTLDAVEYELDDKDFYRNPVSYLTYREVRKEDDDKKDYTLGSWAYYPDGVFGTYQVHITLYSAFDDGMVDIYAHHERNWIRHPFLHLQGYEYDAEKGGEILESLLSDTEYRKEFRDKDDRGY